MPENLIAYVCPECYLVPGDYFGHLQRPGTVGETCPNHISRDPESGVITEKRVELVPAKDVARG